MFLTLSHDSKNGGKFRMSCYYFCISKKVSVEYRNTTYFRGRKCPRNPIHYYSEIFYDWIDSRSDRILSCIRCLVNFYRNFEFTKRRIHDLTRKIQCHRFQDFIVMVPTWETEHMLPTHLLQTDEAETYDRTEEKYPKTQTNNKTTQQNCTKQKQTNKKLWTQNRNDTSPTYNAAWKCLIY